MKDDVNISCFSCPPEVASGPAVWPIHRAAQPCSLCVCVLIDIHVPFVLLQSDPQHLALCFCFNIALVAGAIASIIVIICQCLTPYEMPLHQGGVLSKKLSFLAGT